MKIVVGVVVLTVVVVVNAAAAAAAAWIILSPSSSSVVVRQLRRDSSSSWLPPPHDVGSCRWKLQLPSLLQLHAGRNNNNNVDKGFNLLERATKLVPQGTIVTTVSESWKFVWKRMMTELAPQDKTGNYQRPSYTTTTTTTTAVKLLNEPGQRYHVYTGNPCPWCHRVVLTMKVLQQDEIGWTVLEDNPRQASRGGWILSSSQPDRIFGGCRDLREIYNVLSPGYTGRCTAPLLVDVKAKRIVSNESADICRTLIMNAKQQNDNDNQNKLDLFPLELQTEIEESIEWIYRLLNNGVYRCGFATTQQAYENASRDVVEGLRRCEERLSQHDYMCGNQFTEADIRLLPTLLRYDGVYGPLFKAGGTHVSIQSHYPAIHAWLCRCWNTVPGVSDSIDLADACASYYKQLFPLNPSGIIPHPPVTPQGLGLID